MISDSDKIPPEPIPWIAEDGTISIGHSKHYQPNTVPRPAMSIPIDCEAPQMAAPAAKTKREKSMSGRRPKIMASPVGYQGLEPVESSKKAARSPPDAGRNAVLFDEG